MAWTAPMTAVAGTAFTAAQFNQYVRDNLLETAPAKATTAGQIFVSTAANAIAARTPAAAIVATSQTTTSNTYADLATPGPAVTSTTGTQALVMLFAALSDATGGQLAYMSWAVSGATTVAADDSQSLTSGASSNQCTAAFLQTGLTPGSNVFTAKYRTSGGSTGTYVWRRIIIIPL